MTLQDIAKLMPRASLRPFEHAEILRSLMEVRGWWWGGGLTLTLTSTLNFTRTRTPNLYPNPNP